MADNDILLGGNGDRQILLNAGMVPASLDRTSDGIEMCFAASLVGHHIITTALLDAELISSGGWVVLVGSEGAGKSTWARLGEEAGAHVVSDDLVLVDPSESGFCLLGAPFRD